MIVDAKGRVLAPSTTLFFVPKIYEKINDQKKNTKSTCDREDNSSYVMMMMMMMLMRDDCKHRKKRNLFSFFNDNNNTHCIEL